MTDFDLFTMAAGTGSLKWDGGRAFASGGKERPSDPLTIPLFSDETDLGCPPEVLNAIEERLKRGTLGISDAAFYPGFMKALRRYYGITGRRDIKPVFAGSFFEALRASLCCLKAKRISVFGECAPETQDFLKASGHTLVSCAEEADAILVQTPSAVRGVLYDLEKIKESCGKKPLLIDGRGLENGECMTVLRGAITFSDTGRAFNFEGMGACWAFLPRSMDILPFLSVRPDPLALAAMRAAFDCADYKARAREYVRGNFEMAEKLLRKELPAAKVHIPEAGFHFLIDLSAFRDAALRIRLEANVVPEDGLRYSLPGFIRINAGTQRAVLREALLRIIYLLKKED